MKWIAYGWDCEDEYWNDLSYREKEQELIVRFGIDISFSNKLRKRIARIDKKFKQVTV